MRALMMEPYTTLPPLGRAHGDQLPDGDDSDLFLGGGAGQRLWGDRVEYGFEGGAVVTIINDTLVVAGLHFGERGTLKLDGVQRLLTIGGRIWRRTTTSE